MSHWWLPDKPISSDELKKLKSETIYITPETIPSPDEICLTDGKGALWASRTDLGYSHFTEYHALVNDLFAILAYLSEASGVKWVTDYGSSTGHLSLKR